jgi:predicted nucleic acid-binding protein
VNIEIVNLLPSSPPQLSDPNDEMVLEAAINDFAEAILTHNTRDFLPPARWFGVKVITPGSILKERFPA